MVTVLARKIAINLFYTLMQCYYTTLLFVAVIITCTFYLFWWLTDTDVRRQEQVRQLLADCDQTTSCTSSRYIMLLLPFNGDCQNNKTQIADVCVSNKMYALMCYFTTINKMQLRIWRMYVKLGVMAIKQGSIKNAHYHNKSFRPTLYWYIIKSINLPFLNIVTAMSSTYNKH